MASTTDERAVFSSMLRYVAIAVLSCQLCACKHNHPSPAPTPTPAPADSVTEATRSARFDSELTRSRARWQEKPDLDKCADILPEKSDSELCNTAASALAAVEAQGPAITPDAALPLLTQASLALVRLLERARYLNFQDFGRRRLEGDAGAPAPSSSASPALAPTPSALPPSAQPLRMQRAFKGLLREHSALKVGESPLSHLVETTARLERDVLRNFAAYLEYAPLPVRQAAYASVKQLLAEHPQWPSLNHVLREASVLETDSSLKQNLMALASLGLPRGRRPDQPTGSK